MLFNQQHMVGDVMGIIEDNIMEYATKFILLYK